MSAAEEDIPKRGPILEYPDPRLLMVCEPVLVAELWNVYETSTRDQIGKLFDDMWAQLELYMGYGLAAPQLGSPCRAIIVHVPGGHKIELVNPVIVKAWGGKFLSDEGCLSWPGKRLKVMRHRQVKVKGYDRLGMPVGVSGRNVQAAALQHEIQHLDGINLADHARDRQADSKG